jgi:hypothetical protein
MLGGVERKEVGASFRNLSKLRGELSKKTSTKKGISKRFRKRLGERIKG